MLAAGAPCCALLSSVITWTWEILLTHGRQANFSGLLCPPAFFPSHCRDSHTKLTLQKIKRLNMTNGLVNGNDIEGQFSASSIRHRSSLTKHRYHPAALGLNKSAYVPPHMRQRAAAAAVAPAAAVRYVLLLPTYVIDDANLNCC